MYMFCKCKGFKVINYPEDSKEWASTGPIVAIERLAEPKYGHLDQSGESANEESPLPSLTAADPNQKGDSGNGSCHNAEGEPVEVGCQLSCLRRLKLVRP